MNLGAPLVLTSRNEFCVFVKREKLNCMRKDFHASMIGFVLLAHYIVWRKNVPDTCHPRLASPNNVPCADFGAVMVKWFELAHIGPPCQRRFIPI
jgi:hypothetical protein